MKRTILKNVGIGLCFLLSSGTVCAQNYPGKVKNAQGIEVTYQSNYKGKARPGHLLMTVSGDRVSLTNVWPEQNDRPSPRPEDKTPVTGSYIDYTTRQAYRRAELPNGQVISAVTPFEFGKGFTQTGEGRRLGMNCKILRTSINSNTIEVWYTNDIPFRGTPQANVGVPDGLVLRVVRNGDMIQEATHITPLKKGKDVLPQSWGERAWMRPTTNIPSTKAELSQFRSSTSRASASTTLNCPKYWRMAYNTVPEAAPSC